jgi:multicomponent Na+:H+ antiporter subunit A
LPGGGGPIEAVFLLGLIALATVVVVTARSRLAAIGGLGGVGGGVALTFLVFGAPDIALTQLLVETLTVIIVSLVLLRLPPLKESKKRTAGRRALDAGLSLAAGLLIASLLMGVDQGPLDRSLTEFFENNSYVAAHGRNVVNVILVDFRGLDTLGEITVVVLAGLAGVALIRRPAAGENEGDQIRSVILQTATRLMVGIILVFAAYLLLRGHQEPGGGFAGALVAGTAFALFGIAEGPVKVRLAVRVRPAVIAAAGLATAAVAGLVGLFAAAPFLTGVWWNITPHIAVGTPILFDIGVFMAVLGAILAVLLALEEN